jgi:hypothetical protein
MTTAAPRFLFWAPRILGSLFAIFLSVFALDAFQDGRSLWSNALALLMHLLPTALVALLVALAWRHELFGAIVFSCLGVLYIVWARGRFNWLAYAFIAGPLFVVGSLFLASWVRKRGVPPRTSAASSH